MMATTQIEDERVARIEQINPELANNPRFVEMLIRPDLQPDEAQLYAARAEIKHAYSSYYPSLTFDGSLLRFQISECLYRIMQR